MALPLHGARTRLVDWFRAFFTEEGDPRNLAIFRLCLFGALAGYAAVEAERLIFLAGFPAELRFHDRSLGLGPTGARAALVVLLTSCMCGLFDRAPRVAALVAAGSCLVLFPLLRWFGHANYNHLFVWSLLGFAAAPRSLAPQRVLTLQLGLLYLGSGLAKITALGTSWVSASHLQTIFFRRWFLYETWDFWTAIPWNDTVWSTLAAATLLFEFSFLPLVLLRRTRNATFLAAAVFHATIAVTMRIHFLWLVVLLLGLVQWFPVRGTARASHKLSKTFVAFAFVTLAIQLCVLGAKGNLFWPIGRFPAFFFRPAQQTVTWGIETAGADGNFAPFDETHVRRKFAPLTLWIDLLYAIDSTPAVEQRTLRYQALWRYLRQEKLVAPDQLQVRIYRQAYRLALPRPELVQRNVVMEFSY